MNEMLSNGISSIVSLARNEKFKKVIDGPTEMVFLDCLEGTKVTIEKKPSKTDHVFHDIESFVHFVTNENLSDKEQVIFIEPRSITSVLDYDDHRIHRVKTPLNQSPILDFISLHVTAEPKDLIRQIKFHLSTAALSPDPLPSLQTLKFDSSSLSEYDTKSQDEGVSKSLRNKVTGSTDIPEKFTVTFQMYPAIADQLVNNGSVSVELELHVDLSRQILGLRPLPGSIEFT